MSFIGVSHRIYLASHASTSLDEMDQGASFEIKGRRMIDWTNGADKVSRYFRVREALWLPKWNRMASESDGLNADAKAGLTEIFDLMDQVRDLLGVPLIVHCAFRPEKYNLLVNGAVNSYHKARVIMIEGKRYLVGAVDFHPAFDGLSVPAACDRGKEILRPELDRLGLRMELNGDGAAWIHLDCGPVPKGGNREFRIAS